MRADVKTRIGSLFRINKPYCDSALRNDAYLSRLAIAVPTDLADLLFNEKTDIYSPANAVLNARQD